MGERKELLQLSRWEAGPSSGELYSWWIIKNFNYGANSHPGVSIQQDNHKHPILLEIIKLEGNQ